jgi:hypothetical protein
VVDTALVGLGEATRTLGLGIRGSVSGNAQHYGLLMALGVLAAIAFALFRS